MKTIPVVFLMKYLTEIAKTITLVHQPFPISFASKLFQQKHTFLNTSNNKEIDLILIYSVCVTELRMNRFQKRNLSTKWC